MTNCTINSMTVRNVIDEEGNTIVVDVTRAALEYVGLLTHADNPSVDNFYSLVLEYLEVYANHNVESAKLDRWY